LPEGHAVAGVRVGDDFFLKIALKANAEAKPIPTPASNDGMLGFERDISKSRATTLLLSAVVNYVWEAAVFSPLDFTYDLMMRW